MSHPSDTPHSAHVESRSRKALRSYIIQAATLLEIVLSGLVLIGLLLSAVPLIKWMPGLLFDGNEVEIRTFLERSLDIVIGIEFTNLTIYIQKYITQAALLLRLLQILSVNQIYNDLHHHILLLGSTLGYHQRERHKCVVGNALVSVLGVKHAVVVEEP